MTVRDQLENIYRSHRQGLFSLAMSITGCRQLAEDAIQSAFEKLCRSAASPNGDIVGYVFASIRNSARDAVASRKRTNGLRQSIFDEAPPNSISHINLEDNVLTEERDRILRGAVQALNDDAREVVVMKIFAGLTFDAISEVLNEPAKTVATRYRRAIIKLEEKLRGQL